MFISNTCVFLQRSIYPNGGGKLLCNKLFLKVPWVNKQLASSDFIFRRREKADGVKYVKNGAGRTS
jgi:hypothetical protein